MKIAVIGVGYWGPNLVRNLLNNNEIEEVLCFDVDRSRLNAVKQQFPAIVEAESFEEILKNSKINAVVIATPVSTHFELARKALENGKHIFVEKPFTSSAKDAKILVEMSRKNNLRLVIDHIFMYNGAVRKIKEIIDSGEIGEIMYFDAVRINLGLFQHDVNVVWDLATHDLSIMDYLLGKCPTGVSAMGIGHYNHIEDIAYMTLFFKDSCIAHFHVNWLAPVKVRRILIGGTQKMIVYDDMETVEKIRVYDRGVDITTREGIYRTLIQYRTGDMYAPKFDTTEPLSMITGDFVRSIKNGTEPLSNGSIGLRIVEVLEAAERSIKDNGCLVSLNGNE